jgi:hypothetical protein
VGAAFGTSIHFMKRSKRSRAASKGWATRRANSARRSAAAKKGWQSRRLKDVGFIEYIAPLFFDDEIYEIDY